MSTNYEFSSIYLGSESSLFLVGIILVDLEIYPEKLRETSRENNLNYPIPPTLSAFISWLATIISNKFLSTKILSFIIMNHPYIFQTFYKLKEHSQYSIVEIIQINYWNVSNVWASLRNLPLRTVTLFPPYSDGKIPGK